MLTWSPKIILVNCQVNPLMLISQPMQIQSEPPAEDVIPSSASGPHVAVPEESDYGPVRRKVRGKSGPAALYRPSSMAQDDFADMMQEVVPQLMEQVLSQEGSSASSSSAIPAGHGQKRDASVVHDHTDEHAKARRTESPVRSDVSPADVYHQCC